MPKIDLYQIYYNEETYRGLDSAFLPLDNSQNLRPEWYEFWPIRNFLNGADLSDPDRWLGFFSPKFATKSGLSGAQVKDFVASMPEGLDVMLFSPAWDQIAFFRNTLEQGDSWHPGMSTLMQAFVDHIGLDFDVKGHVADTLNSCFSNYLVAKTQFWKDWLALANLFFDFVEAGESSASHEARQATPYGASGTRTAPMRTFIQERLVNLLLCSGKYSVSTLDMSAFYPLFTQQFANTFANTRLLYACDLMKQEFRRTGDNKYLDMFYTLREQVQLARPTPLWDKAT